MTVTCIIKNNANETIIKVTEKTIKKAMLKASEQLGKYINDIRRVRGI